MIVIASLSEISGPTPPDWIKLLPAGTAVPRDGRTPWHVDPHRVVAATRAAQGGTDLAVDYEHQSVNARHNGQPAPAAGWIKELDARPDGVWGRVQWTESAAAHIARREYRYISPAFDVDASGQAVRLVSAGLTATPALDLPALASQTAQTPPLQTTDQTTMLKDSLAALLGLAASADDQKIVDAVRSLSGAHAQLCAAVGQPVTASVETLVQTASSIAARAASPDPAHYVPVAALNAVNAELATLKTAAAKAEAEALVTAAQAAGKLAPALRDWGVTFAAADPAGFRAWTEAAPVVVASVQPAPALLPQTAGQLTSDQMAVCTQLGLTPEQFRAAGGV
jgi:phage I-like protein